LKLSSVSLPVKNRFRPRVQRLQFAMKEIMEILHHLTGIAKHFQTWCFHIIIRMRRNGYCI